MIYPMATEPSKVALPNWPMTAVSTAPIKGTVAFDRTMGKAMRKMRARAMGAMPMRQAGNSGTGGISR